MELIIDNAGGVRCIYDEAIDLAVLGKPTITRASHVEPDENGHWWADLSPVGGPRLGPFGKRSDALDVERTWVGSSLWGFPQNPAAPWQGVYSVRHAFCISSADRL